jgi:hypothetical protein
MGHADIQTTRKYPHYESRKEDADLVARASARRVRRRLGRTESRSNAGRRVERPSVAPF